MTNFVYFKYEYKRKLSLGHKNIPRIVCKEIKIVNN
jgi:hypothetical protein